jgi:cytochrome c oxidase subunit II
VRRRRHSRWPALAALATTAAACSRTFGFPEGRTVQGEDARQLWHLFMLAAIAVAAIVYGLIAWSLVRYRQRRNDPPDGLGKQGHSNVPIEIVYTAIPIVIVVVLFAWSLRTDERVTSPAADPSVTVHVEAFSWGWRLEYPELGVVVVAPPSSPTEPGPELVLPLGETTRVILTSNDVIHAFWVPEFDFKRDAIPGHTTEFDLTPNQAGTFRGVCGEFCGLNHAYMTFRVTVVDRPTFDRWVADRAGEATAA